MYTPFTYFSHSPPLATTNLFFVSMSLFFVVVVFKFPYIREIMWYLSFSNLFRLAYCPQSSCCHR